MAPDESFNEASNPSIFQKLFNSLTKPEDSFKTIRKEPFSSTFIYFLFILSIPTLIRILLVVAGVPVQNDKIETVLAGFVLTIILTFLFVGIFHISAKIFGGNASYDGTYKAYVYGFTAATLFGWIPYVGIIGLIYGVYCFVKGISFIHAITTGKAFLTWLFPIILCAILIVIIVLLIGLTFVSFLAGWYSANPQMFETMQATGQFLRTLRV